MPVSKNPKKTKRTSASASVSASPHTQLCDGCSAAISSENDALKCSVCSVQLHRYCAGIPQCHYQSIATSFVCIACSLTASKSVVAELRNEISALKAEVTELRSALVEEKKVSWPRRTISERKRAVLHTPCGIERAPAAPFGAAFNGNERN